VADFTLPVARRFQMWDFSKSHSMLLLRSTLEEKFPTRIDLLFTNVLAFQLGTVLDVLSVTATPANEAAAPLFLGAWPRITGAVTLKNQWLYTIGGAEGDAYVVAGFFSHNEDQGSWDDPSPLDIQPPHPAA